MLISKDSKSALQGPLRKVPKSSVEDQKQRPFIISNNYNNTTTILRGVPDGPKDIWQKSRTSWKIIYDSMAQGSNSSYLEPHKKPAASASWFWFWFQRIRQIGRACK